MTSPRTARRIATAAIGLLFGLSIGVGAYAQAVLQNVTVKVNPGQLDAYIAKVRELQGVMDRVGGGGKVTVWQATAAGTNAGNTLVSVAYPSLTAYAETTTKVTADPEWQKILTGLPAMRTTLSTILVAARDGGGPPAPAAPGSVLQLVLVQVNPGQLDRYVERINALKAIQTRLGSSGVMRVWQATVAGATTGTVAVGITHPSLIAYAENAGKLQGDAEAEKLLDGLDGIRTIVSTSLSAAQ
jgi:hypothetical protein